jgi:hypothetical protein
MVSKTEKTKHFKAANEYIENILKMIQASHMKILCTILSIRCVMQKFIFPNYPQTNIKN